MKILGIDTSNQGLGVALIDGDRIVENVLGEKSKNHSVTLMPAINNVFETAGWQPKDIQRVVVAAGPGSYTGLRIGVTTAKTLAWTLNCDLVAVSSLAGIAANSKDFSGLIVPIFDARRENVYTGAYTWENNELITVIADKHLPMSQWLAELSEMTDQPIRFVGEDVAHFSEMISEVLPESEISTDITLNQVNAGNLALLGRIAEPVADIHQFVPNYLKRVEAEENWLKDHAETSADYVAKVNYSAND